VKQRKTIRQLFLQPQLARDRAALWSGGLRECTGLIGVPAAGWTQPPC